MIETTIADKDVQGIIDCVNNPVLKKQLNFLQSEAYYHEINAIMHIKNNSSVGSRKKRVNEYIDTKVNEVLQVQKHALNETVRRIEEVHDRHTLPDLEKLNKQIEQLKKEYNDKQAPEIKFRDDCILKLRKEYQDAVDSWEKQRLKLKSEIAEFFVRVKDNRYRDNTITP